MVGRGGGEGVVPCASGYLFSAGDPVMGPS